MAKVQATCQHCGRDVHLRSEALELHICIDTHIGVDLNTFQFTCPLCELRTEQFADAEVVKVLTAVEVPTFNWRRELVEDDPENEPEEAEPPGSETNAA